MFLLELYIDHRVSSLTLDKFQDFRMSVSLFNCQVTRMKDRVAVCNIIPVLVHCENERAYEDTFLHSLISFLIAMSDEFAHDDFCSVVFDDYLLVRTCIYRHAG